MNKYIDEDQVREFIRRLPDLQTDDMPTCYFAMLCIRSRWCKEFTGQKIKDIVVERKNIRPSVKYPNEWREKYLRKIYNLSTLQNHGQYLVKDVLVPKETLSIMAVITPRHVLRAYRDLSKYAIDRIIDKNLNALNRLDIEFISGLHRNKTPEHRGRVTVDIDDPNIYKNIYDDLSVLDKWMITATSRGYHIILDLKGQQAEDFYKPPNGIWPTMNKKYNTGDKDKVELQRRAQEPVPGTYYYSPLRKDNFVRILE